MQNQAQTVIADFAIEGRLAYLSHQETLTMFQRALLRAGVPVAFSGGFNPRPRVSIPLPRSVGTQSETERVCAVLAWPEPVDADAVKSRLAGELPAGCSLGPVTCLAGKHTFHPSGVCYVFTLASEPDAERQRHLAACRTRLDTGGPIEVQRYRTRTKRTDPFDIAPFVQQLTVSGSRIEVVCRVSQAGSVRIDELMQWMHLEIKQLAEPVRRTAIHWREHYQEQE